MQNKGFRTFNMWWQNWIFASILVHCRNINSNRISCISTCWAKFCCLFSMQLPQRNQLSDSRFIFMYWKVESDSPYGIHLERSLVVSFIYSLLNCSFFLFLFFLVSLQVDKQSECLLRTQVIIKHLKVKVPREIDGLSYFQNTIWVSFCCYHTELWPKSSPARRESGRV